MNLYLSLEARHVHEKEKSLFSWQLQVAIGLDTSLGVWEPSFQAQKKGRDRY